MLLAQNTHAHGAHEVAGAASHRGKGWVGADVALRAGCTLHCGAVARVLASHALLWYLCRVGASTAMSTPSTFGGALWAEVAWAAGHRGCGRHLTR